MSSNAKLKVTNSVNRGEHVFAIEHNVPLILKKPNPFHGLFAAMKDNDSFLIDESKERSNKVKYHATRWARDNGSKFVFRNTADGIRCWKVN